MEENIVWLITGLSFLVGCGAGALITLWVSPAQQKRRELEQESDKQKREQQNYQEEVAQHFNKSAELLAQMADSYKAVHQHLSHSAHNLCPDSFKLSTDLALLENQAKAAPSQLEQPLDYAPRQASNNDGVLNEAYGLDKEEKAKEDDISELNITTPAEAAKLANPKML